MKKNTLLILFTLVSALVSCNPRVLEDGQYTLHILSTNDVHGSWFDSSYVDNSVRTSLYAAKYSIDSVRNVVGEENILLIDAGDCLQGNNAAYYYNYVDTTSPHLFPQLMSYMGYDAVVVGNHDIETGHAVYDRINKELNYYGIPFLAGNAVRTNDNRPYFQPYATFDKAGLKVLVLGYTNANMKAWLNKSLWSGMDFKSLLPLVQEDVDRIVAKEKPNVVIVAMHSGAGDGDGQQLESQAMDLFNTLRGVDFIICAHDHIELTAVNGSIALLNSGSKAKNLAHGVLTVNVKNGEIASKEFDTELITVNAKKVDKEMRQMFHNNYEAVKSFTLKEVGELKEDLVTTEAYAGMSNYLNLIHTIGLEYSDISIAAPLTFNGKVEKGTIVYNDLFTIYPFENQMYILTMSGEEIKNYLEYSYDGWINTVEDLDSAEKDGSGLHVLKIEKEKSLRYGLDSWSFVNRTYNFDSAAGICYTVDVTKSFGERIQIESMADGTQFISDKVYKVAMTSYRASGGGSILSEGAGIEDSEKRIVEKNEEYRELIFKYLQKYKVIDPAVIGDEAVIGHWAFIPEKEASEAIARDLKLIFR